MARKSFMITFDSDAFRELVKKHGSVLADLESVTGVSKQAVNAWLSSSKIPPRQLHTVANKLNWSAQEIARVVKKNGGQAIRFRSHRHTLAGEGAETTARRIANDFFILDNASGNYSKDSFVLRVGKHVSASNVADAILRQLNLKRGQFGTEELISSLARINISVIFLDFGINFSLDEKATRNLKAFCAKQGSKYLIAIDSRMKSEDVTWAIFHELAHIAYGDIDEDGESYPEDNKTEEKLRSEVANEVLTPTELLLSSKDDLEKLLNCNLRLLPCRIEHVASELGASFVGVMLALKKIGLLTPMMERYLWGVQKRRDETRLSVKDFIAPTSAETLNDWLVSWDRVMNTEQLQQFLKLHMLVRQGLVEDRLSLARAAELLGIEVGEMEELAKHWSAEVGNEATD